MSLGIPYRLQGVNAQSRNQRCSSQAQYFRVIFTPGPYFLSMVLVTGLMKFVSNPSFSSTILCQVFLPRLTCSRWSAEKVLSLFLTGTLLHICCKKFDHFSLQAFCNSLRRTRKRLPNIYHFVSFRTSLKTRTKSGQFKNKFSPVTFVRHCGSNDITFAGHYDTRSTT